MTNPNQNPYQSPSGEQAEEGSANVTWSWFEIFGAVLGLVFLTVFLMAFIGYSPFLFLWKSTSGGPSPLDVVGVWLLAMVLGPIFFLTGLAWVFGWKPER